ncbi:NADH-quinone oxidoreductase subunit J family protein [Schlesneria paludicola]|uniref:NADH-quinone oxidoreductase subunit J family protein n=1 Tax=Schlesneria paludicola TaxID=360056 RepID=UPI00029B48F2|nr:NADH-quinone oxidoreductase subunit J [Schlesneria paludicola]
MIEQLLFWVFATLSCGGAVAVVATQNVVRMAFWLVVSLGSVGALFFLCDADFLGSAQLLIYVGGTVVLLVFGVMLTASGPYTQIRTNPAEIFLGASVGLLLLFVLVTSISKVDWKEAAERLPPSPSMAAAAELAPAARQQGNTVRQLGLSFIGLRPDRNLNQDSQMKLAPGFLLPFEIISIHLLVVLIGAAYLARAKRRVVVDDGREFN